MRQVADMSLQMHSIWRALREALPANLALKRTFAGMCSHVGSDFRGIPQKQTTVFTGFRLKLNNYFKK